MWQEIKYFSVAVTDLEAGIKVYEDMFDLKPMTEITETRWGFRAVMLGNGDRMQVEMVQPSNPESPLARFMKERSRSQNQHGEGIYIIGVAVDNLAESVARVRQHGGKVAQDPELPNLAWVHPLTSKYVLLELQGPPSE
jgi:predicted enzyme related to lactoylglutathione lyase